MRRPPLRPAQAISTTSPAARVSQRRRRIAGQHHAAHERQWQVALPHELIVEAAQRIADPFAR